jgi:hypothetical protein
MSETRFATLLEPKAYTMPMLTAATGIGRPKLYEEIKAKRLKVKQVGGRTVVLAKDLDAWLQALPDGTRPSHNPKGRVGKAA